MKKNQTQNFPTRPPIVSYILDARNDIPLCKIASKSIKIKEKDIFLGFDVTFIVFKGFGDFWINKPPKKWERIGKHRGA